MRHLGKGYRLAHAEAEKFEDFGSNQTDGMRRALQGNFGFLTK
jgi:hypothetical protein